MPCVGTLRSTDLRKLLARAESAGDSGSAHYDRIVTVKWGGPAHESEHTGAQIMKEHDDVMLYMDHTGAVRVLLSHLDRRVPLSAPQYLSCGHLDVDVAAEVTPMIRTGSGFSLAYARLGPSRRSYDGRLVRIVIVKQY